MTSRDHSHATETECSRPPQDNCRVCRSQRTSNIASSVYWSARQYARNQCMERRTPVDSRPIIVSVRTNHSRLYSGQCHDPRPPQGPIHQQATHLVAHHCCRQQGRPFQTLSSSLSCPYTTARTWGTGHPPILPISAPPPHYSHHQGRPFQTSELYCCGRD